MVECHTGASETRVHGAGAGADSPAVTRGSKAAMSPSLGAIEGVANDVPLAPLRVQRAAMTRAGSVTHWALPATGYPAGGFHRPVATGDLNSCMDVS